MEYYGNNDWRDYLALKHYGVKGMKWHKHLKRLPISIDINRGELGSNSYGYKTKGISISGRNGMIAGVTKTTHRKNGTNYELTVKRRKAGSTYDRSKGPIQNYSDDEDYRTVGIHVNKAKTKRAKRRIRNALRRWRS